MRRVVVTGIGIFSPLGFGAKAFWEALLGGKCGIGPITAFDPAAFPCRIAGQVPAYRITDFVPKAYRKATKVMARDIEIAVIAADDAFKDSGLQSHAYAESPNFDGTRFGCNIGAGLISPELNELTTAMSVAGDKDDPHGLDLRRWGRDGMSQLTPLWLLKYLPNMLACHVTIIHQIKGPSNTITCAEASSHLAIGEAFRTLQRGKADMAICGGAESKVNPMTMLRQTLLKRLNVSKNDDPAIALRPFDADAEGTIVGEGGGLFILEELEHARKRNARIYAELVGFAASQDSYRITDPEPSGHSYAQAIINALKDGGAKPEDVDLLIPNGLGLPSHDRAELAGLKKAFGPALAKVAISTVKPQIGGLSAGSGVDVAAAVLGLYHGKIPPAINSRQIIDGIPLNVAAQTRDADLKLAASSTYSLGGQNAALVFRSAKHLV